MISSSYDTLYKATSPRFIKRWWRHTHNHRTDSSTPKQCYFITWGNLKSKLHRENPWEVHKSNFNFLVITRSMTPDDVIQPSTRLSDANPRVERIRSRIEGANTLTQNHKHSGRCHTDVGYAQPSDWRRTSGRCVFDINKRSPNYYTDHYYSTTLMTNATLLLK